MTTKLPFLLCLALVTSCGGAGAEVRPGDDSGAGYDVATETDDAVADDAVIDSGGDSSVVDGDAGRFDSAGDSPADVPGPDASICTPGATDCVGNAPRTCGPTGTWTVAAPCAAPLPACVGGACRACAPGDAKCVGNSTASCDPSGAWRPPVACPFACKGAGSCDGVCVPGAARCSGATSQSCDATGSWVTAMSCPFLCTGSGTCSGTCAPGATRCNGLAAQTCDSTGTWQTSQTCTYVCSSGVCGGSCSPGAVQCSGSNVQTCSSAGAWATTQTCAFSCSGGVCGGTCTPTTTRCNGKSVETCNAAGSWQTTTSCPYVCLGTACSGVCTPGATKCNGSLVQTCDAAGTWQTTTTCPFVCASGTCVGVCAPGTSRCNGTLAQTCDATGSWTTTATCPFVCSSGACTGTCVPGTTQCTGLNAQTCDAAGTWQTTATCPFVCTAGGCTGSCHPGATQCSGTKIQTCSALGQWPTAADCAPVANAAAYCSAGACTFACNAGYADCDGVAGNGCEASLNTDSANCGSCGRSCCAGGTCTAGTCGAATVVSDTGYVPFDIDAANVYSIGSCSPPTSGCSKISRTPKNGGLSVAIATGTAGPSYPVNAIITDGAHVYWQSGTPLFSINSVAVTGGAVTPVVSDGVVKSALARDSTRLFWANASGVGTEVAWSALAGGSSGTTVPSSAVQANEILSDGKYIYYTESTYVPSTPCGSSFYTSVLKKVLVTGGTSTVIDSGCGFYSAFFADGTNLYYTRGQVPIAQMGTWAYALSGTASPRFVDSSYFSASDGSYLYGDMAGGLGKYAIASGAKQNLSSRSPSGAVKVDAKCVYFASTGTGIMTVNKVP